MQRKSFYWLLLGLFCLAGGGYLLSTGHRKPQSAAATASATSPAKNGLGAQSKLQSATPVPSTIAKSSAGKSKDPYPFLLRNTTNSVDELVKNDKAIMLMNALIDTSKPVNLEIPAKLRAPANNGSYIVQANGLTDDRFRAALKNAGASIISYIPNNAYLVRVSADGAQKLSALSQTQSVLPYEPYYKLDPSLLKMAIEDKPDAQLPHGGLNLTLFADNADATLAELKNLGASVQSQERSPFGPLVKVFVKPGTLDAIASLPGVQGVTTWHIAKSANDLSRPALGVAADTVTGTNWLGLTGINVKVGIVEDGIDAAHPDLVGRIFGDPTHLTDQDNFPGGLHGTHVAGSILGSGVSSANVINAQGSLTNANFRGMAPSATGLEIYREDSDEIKQETAATNALISNNSWTYGNQAYDIQAASYDAAVRDALPLTNGSQPVLFVFAAGNSGSGYSDGTGGFADTVESPGTAKNVITVGALEQPRHITNTWEIVTDGATNSFSFFDETDTSDQVAGFSSRGNVGVNIEGGTGRFKPDVVAPGVMTISCRSEQWDTNSYYSNTNSYFYPFPNNVVGTNGSFASFHYPLPSGVIGMNIYLFPNAATKNGVLPTMPIYVGVNAFPTDTGAATGNNTVLLPSGSIPINDGDTVYFDVGNTTNYNVDFDVELLITYTNNVGTYETVLQGLNDNLCASPQLYRYESGTSMAAAKITGVLALMQDYLQTHSALLPSYPPSPALMKAMLINGSRSVSDQYTFSPNIAANPNEQGWGEPSLPNILPAELTNSPTVAPIILIDQDPAFALATGQSLTRTINVSTNGTNQDLRITLVWTDPPGNPSAGVKLVNDLDLIVSNRVTGEVYYGNDFRSDIPYNNVESATNAAVSDSINNVENVYVQGPLSGNAFDITVLGRRVNVNAVTANTNNVVQDYALVITSGDGLTSSNNSFSQAITAPVAAANTYISNFFVLNNGQPVFNQRVGANSQFSGSTNGVTNQWNFYIFTNTPGRTNANFTNVAFTTFAPPNLGLPRMGALGEVAPPDVNATRYIGADIDMFVSTDPNLTNLVPAVLASASRSVSRTGTESVYFVNDPPGLVYYVAIKSEDQQAAQYSLVGFATDQPFGGKDKDGNFDVNMFSFPSTALLPGVPPYPSTNISIGIATADFKVRNAVFELNVSAQDFANYIGGLSEGTNFVVINNHDSFTNVNDASESFTFDDSGENRFPGSRGTSGPGSMRGFMGMNAAGTTWIYTIVNDNSFLNTGKINSMQVVLVPQETNNTFNITIEGLSWFYDFVDVPANATNLTISVNGNTLPLDLVIGYNYIPDLVNYDEFAFIGNGGGSLSVNRFTDPPINAGRYFFGIYNPNINAMSNVTVTIEVDLSLTPVQGVNFLPTNAVTIQDDAVTLSTNRVASSNIIVSAEVGVRIDHPRESDLVLTLISPSGTRVLLAENRGGFDTNGYGNGINITNFFNPQTSGGIAESITNLPLTTNFGTLIVNYQFFNVPDDMRIYYDGRRIYDTGLVSGASQISVDFGPGFSTNITIIMNEPGTNPGGTNGDAWNYTATVVTRDTAYATFTENTNLTTTPIKFAVPPFGGGAAYIPPATNFISDFETSIPGDYSSSNVPPIVDGWTLTSTNPVTVVTGTNIANTGTNLLDLHSGIITRTVSNLVPGYNYTFTFASRALPTPRPVGWWKGDGSGHDYVYGNDGVLTNTFYTNGIVNQAFSFDYQNFLPTPTYVAVQIPDSTNYWLTNSLTIEGWIKQDAFSFDIVFGRGDSGPYDPWLIRMQGQFFTFDITDVNGVQDEIFAPAALNYGQWYYVAATYDGATSNMSVYVDGNLAAQKITSIRPFGDFATTSPPHGIDPGVGIGNFNDGSGGPLTPYGTAPFIGEVDEITLYSNALNAQQILDIYKAGPLGKTLPVGTLLYGGTSNTITGTAEWTTNFYTFTAPSNSMTFTIYANSNSLGQIEDGILLDSFALIQDAQPNPANYYLPEESLQKLAGENAHGDWVLEVMDNRAGPNATNTLVSWQLSLVFADSQPAARPLTPFVSQTNTVAPGGFAYYIVDVPAWASFATNIISNATGPVNLWFNQGLLPTGKNTAPRDYDIIPGANPGGTAILTGATTPPLKTGPYYLGVENTGTSPVSFKIEVDFDLTTLLNLVPVTNLDISTGSIPNYFQFSTSNNPVMEEFRIFNASGNVQLVANYGAPLPTQVNHTYASAYAGSNNQTIFLFTNTTPVPATNGLWYLGVFNNDTANVTYSIEAIAVGPPNYIDLTNGIAYTAGVSQPGLPLTNFFRFTVTNTSAVSALFELYQKTGDADLTMDVNSVPYAPLYAASVLNSGTTNNQLVVRTNQVADLVVSRIDGISYILGVPNNDTTNISFTIRASYSTNSILTTADPLSVTATAPPPGSTNGLTLTWNSVYGGCYDVQISPDLVIWNTLTNITGASGLSTSYTDPNPGNGSQFYRVVEVVCP